MHDRPGVRELRLVVTAPDYEEALRFYRDVLGLPERAAYSSPGGRVTILEAGRATLELADPPHAAYIDEVEVGRRALPGTSGSPSRSATPRRPPPRWRRPGPRSSPRQHRRHGSP
jgi:catechol 2,3-dioxygenase-like lactoylglutathione lyase family enzyme